MNCPYCDFENMSGADVCDDCGQALTDLNRPAEMSAFEASIIEDSIETLHPSSPFIVSPSTAVGECIRIMNEHHIGCVLVGTEDDLVGIFSERDLLLRVAPDYAANRDRPVSDFMSPDPECLEFDAPIAFAINRMAVGRFRHVPVTEEGKLTGIISMTDILNHFCTQSQGTEPVPSPPL